MIANSSSTKGLLFLTFCCVLFPYVGPKIIPSDNQPFALILAFMFLLYQRNIIVLKRHYSLAIPVLIALFIGILEYDNVVVSIRSFVGYTSFLVLNIFFYNHSLKHKFPVRLFKRVILVWLFVALFQFCFDKSFLSSIVSNFRIHELRGVVSLASEPSYLGVTGCFFLIISSQFLRSNVYSFLSVVLVGLSQSGFAIILLFFFLFSLFMTRIVKARIKTKLVFSFLLLSLALLVIHVAKDTSLLSQRLAFVVDSLARDPMSFIYSDASAADRFFHVFYSFRGFFENYFLPNGFSYWEVFAWDKFSDSNFVWITTGRIMSTFGAMLFELGLFSFPIIIFINYQLFTSKFKSKYAVLISINFFLLFAIPLVYPLIPLILNLKNYNYD